MRDTKQLRGYLGQQALPDGPSTGRVAANNDGALVASGLNASYYAHVIRGNAFVYTRLAAGGTLVANSTTTRPMVWNPAGSGRNLVVLKIVCGYVSTTWSAGMIEYGYIKNAGAQVGTGAPIVSLTQVGGTNLLLGSRNASVMRFAPTTTTSIAAPTFLCPAGISSNAGTAALDGPPFTMVDWIDGMIIVPPGVAFFVMANAAIAAFVSTAIYGLELPVPLQAC